MTKSVQELEALSSYPEPEGFHAKRLAALQASLQATSSGTAEQQAQLKQVRTAAGGHRGGRVALPLGAPLGGTEVSGLHCRWGPRGGSCWPDPDDAAAAAQGGGIHAGQLETAERGSC